jgi:hypothetical protein
MGCELFDVVVFAGSHVAPDGQMERGESFGLGPADGFDLSKPIEHPQIDIVRIGLGDLPHPLVMILEIARNLEAVECDWRTNAGGIGDRDLVSH